MATVGRVHPNLEARVVGPDGQTLPRGQVCGGGLVGRREAQRHGGMSPHAAADFGPFNTSTG